MSYTVFDRAGNKGSCRFTVRVRGEFLKTLSDCLCGAGSQEHFTLRGYFKVVYWKVFNKKKNLQAYSLCWRQTFRESNQKQTQVAKRQNSDRGQINQTLQGTRHVRKHWGTEQSSTEMKYTRRSG